MINGSILRDAIISGANNIINYRQQVDALNVFPVPDGDTGTNMSMTMTAAKRELERLSDNVSVSEVANIAASALLRGARGNSGVILSLLYRGFSKGLSGKDTADAKDICDALRLGVSAAYKAVMKPTEGTILTVARLAAEYAEQNVAEEHTVSDIFNIIVEQAKIALDQTPEMLPVLKKAGVVDAGGKGLTVIFDGMLSVIKDNTIIKLFDEEKQESFVPFETKNAAGEYEGEITFTYCTEFIVVKNNSKADSLVLRAYLESIGDSVVVVDDDDIIKVHVHTDNPGNALQEGLKFGALTKIKIENMREQHDGQKAAVKLQSASDEFEYKEVNPNVEYGFVSVAAGDGIISLFKDIGADNVVSGGQTMNPSTDDILSAIHATPAKVVFVLPNNKNIIMAAEQAAKLADRKVYVLPTRTVPQGISAMLAFDPEKQTNDNLVAMTKAFERVMTGQITFAARDSDFEGHKIKKGELLALENGKLAFTEKDLSRAVSRVAKNLVKKDSEYSFVTLIYGENVKEEEANQILQAVKEKMPDNVEINLINGGQPVYYFIISAE